MTECLDPYSALKIRQNRESFCLMITYELAEERRQQSWLFYLGNTSSPELSMLSAISYYAGWPEKQQPLLQDRENRESPHQQEVWAHLHSPTVIVHKGSAPLQPHRHIQKAGTRIQDFIDEDIEKVLRLRTLTEAAGRQNNHREGAKSHWYCMEPIWRLGLN